MSLCQLKTSCLKVSKYSRLSGSFEDEDSSEDEGLPDYKLGGYHAVHVGELLLDRYVII